MDTHIALQQLPLPLHLFPAVDSCLARKLVGLAVSRGADSNLFVLPVAC